MKRYLILLALFVLPACGGGGSTPSLPATAFVSPTPSATFAPTSSPTSAPTQPPTAALHVAAAPAQVYTALGLVRRSAQEAKTLAINLGNGSVPTIVVGYSATMGAIFSQFYTWAETSASVPVKESTLNVTPIGPITIQAINQDNTNAFSTTTFDWIVNPGPLTGTGKIQMAVAFGDGTTGIVPYYSYDKWNLDFGGVSTPGTPQQWAYQGGIPVGQVAPADVSLDGAGNIDFPLGASLVSAPVADAYGNLASAFTTTLTATFSNPVTVIPLANLQTGAIYLVKLNDGGFAKFMVLQNAPPFTSPSLIGISEHDSPSGSRSFSF